MKLRKYEEIRRFGIVSRQTQFDFYWQKLEINCLKDVILKFINYTDQVYYPNLKIHGVLLARAFETNLGREKIAEIVMKWFCDLCVPDLLKRFKWCKNYKDCPTENLKIFIKSELDIAYENLRPMIELIR